ncbi:hypothetical protein I317_01661 [Kwoniella heveanensis CBS 569]|nr:hypothetical protein I317_01661 [Kwoniella heveanensis CBS 569]
MIMAAQPPNHPQPFNLPSSPFFAPTTTTTATPASARKRRAASPESPTAPFAAPSSSSFFTLNAHSSPVAAEGGGSDTPQHREKRRRPNLANGFRSLSISRDQLKNGTGSGSTTIPGSGEQSHELFDHTSGEEEEDEGIGLTRINNNDIKVEVLPDRGETASKSHHHHRDNHHHSNLHHWSIPNHAGPSSSSSSPSPTESSEENQDYDSDVTFTRSFPKHRRYAGVAQQADEIQQPFDAQQAYEALQSSFGDREELGVEDVTVPTPLGSRRRREDDQGGPRGKKARMEGEMDVDMGDDGDVEELRRDFSDKRRKRKTVWHEPEKDRIVITSLSDASSSRGSSRSSSPEPSGSADERHLSQPGDQGFMLSPSLLTHLLKAQRNQLNGMNNGNNSQSAQNRNSLILYRPLGIPPGKLAGNQAGSGWTGIGTEPVVKSWQPGENYVDSGRFEEVDDDENFDEPSPAQTEGEGMDIDDDGDVAMD